MRGRIMIVAALAAGLAASAALADLSGRARVIDGDTLEIRGVTVRLLGIDAPEADQTCARAGDRAWPCGRWVTQEVRAYLSGRTVTCAEEGQDRYGRVLGRCRVGDADLSATLAVSGLAWVNPRYELTYQPQEKAAALAGRGLWAMQSVPPWEYRATEAAALAARPPQQAPRTGCVIKGNISSGGRIYHVPGQEHYDRTRIDTARGERWFCSAAEARAAGWRPARR
jgi:endonuclease YncB( thermonuclease family)